MAVLVLYGLLLPRRTGTFNDWWVSNEKRGIAQVLLGVFGCDVFCVCGCWVVDMGCRSFTVVVVVVREARHTPTDDPNGTGCNCVCVCVSTKRRRRGTVVDSSNAAECDNGRLVHIPWCCFNGERGWRIGSSGSTASSSSSSSFVWYKLWCKPWTWETFQKKRDCAGHVGCGSSSRCPSSLDTS